MYFTVLDFIKLFQKTSYSSNFKAYKAACLQFRPSPIASKRSASNSVKITKTSPK